MSLNLKNINDYDWCEVEGKYRYTSSGSGSYINVSGVKQGTHLSLTEYNDQDQPTGYFEGTFDIFGNLASFEYTGTFTTTQNKSFNFNLTSN